MAITDRWIFLALLVLSVSASAGKVQGFPKSLYIDAYFNHQGTNRYTEPYRKITRNGDNFEEIIASRINKAKKKVWLAVQEFRLPGIANSLIAAKSRGVEIKVVIENSYHNIFSDLTAREVSSLSVYQLQRYLDFVKISDINLDGVSTLAEKRKSDAIYILENAGIKIIDDTFDGSKGSGLMHHKFVVIDDDTTIVTSANFTQSDFFGDFSQIVSRGNPNSLVILNSPDINQFFSGEYQVMWGNGRIGGSKFGVDKPHLGIPTYFFPSGESVTISFSPTGKKIPYEKSSNGLIKRTLERARKSIFFNLFVFSEQAIANSMKDKFSLGVDVQGVIEKNFAYRSYSELLDMLGVNMPSGRCKVSRDNNPWKSTAKKVGASNLPSGDRLHHKLAVVDERLIIVGSHNWSTSANQNNDETLLVIESKLLGPRFQSEALSHINRGTLGLTSTISKKISDRKQKCRGKFL
ncbi:MAG: competence protein ComE [Bacteriovoracaceae bacterium]|jgi:phosphatidylserine/phosphatidylglycerophosphate/cardiolipin synthase-like enzyme|nr:competence protein ComE [Bacteriovoracaceae bacterium]